MCALSPCRNPVGSVTMDAALAGFIISFAMAFVRQALRYFFAHTCIADTANSCRTSVCCGLYASGAPSRSTPTRLSVFKSVSDPSATSLASN